MEQHRELVVPPKLKEASYFYLILSYIDKAERERETPLDYVTIKYINQPLHWCTQSPTQQISDQKKKTKPIPVNKKQKTGYNCSLLLFSSHWNFPTLHIKHNVDSILTIIKCSILFFSPFLSFFCTFFPVVYHFHLRPNIDSTEKSWNIFRVCR